MRFDIHESVKKVHGHYQLGYSVIRNVKVQGTPPSLAQKYAQLQTAIAGVYNIDGLTNAPHFVGAHSLYNDNDFDASRYDAVSEALVRRVVCNKNAYYVNSAVTVMNYCSINFLIPVGLYDLDQINGDITYQLSADEAYVNSGSDVVVTDSNLFLSDSKGIFGNHIADTRRTAVTLSTNNLLAVVYGERKIKASELTQILNYTSEMIIRHNGGTIEKQEIVEI